MIKILSQSDEVCVSGIYKITCLANEKVYIGSSIDLDRRYSDHLKNLKNQTHCNPHLQNAWNKYGSESFTFEVIQYVPYLARLIFWEQLYLDYYHAANRVHGFNICPKAGNCLGVKHTLETRAKLSEAKKGNQNTKGFKHSAETCAKYSENRKGKGNQYTRGFKRTAETHAKITASQVKNNPFYWVATSPEGKIYDPIFNLREFCRDHNLHHGNMGGVANGKYKSYKSWLCKKVNKNEGLN